MDTENVQQTKEEFNQMNETQLNNQPVNEQAIVYATVENSNNGLTPQESAIPDSKCGTKNVSCVEKVSAFVGDTEQPDSETVKEETGKVVSKKLTIGQFFALSVLQGMNYTFGRIRINRDIDLRQVKKKISSIIACGGIISPFLVVSAKICLKAGLELEDFDGNPITEATHTLELVLIVIDGQHRMMALKQLNKKQMKEGKPEYEGYCHLPFTKDPDIPTLLREANSATNPWDGMDWLTQLLVTAQDNDISTEKLKWVKEKARSGSDSAAWSWVNDGRTNSKTTCIKASTDAKKLKTLADTTSFEKDKRLYEAATRSFEGNSAKTLGWKVLPEWVYKQLDSLIKKDMKRSEATAMLIRFLEGIGTANAQEISQIKKTANQSKDNMIIARLDELFANFNLNH